MDPELEAVAEAGVEVHAGGPAHQQLQSLLAQQSQLPRTYPSPTPPILAGADPSNLSRCYFCGTSATPLWRRDQSGKAVCNACGQSTIASSVATAGPRLTMDAVY